MSIYTDRTIPPPEGKPEVRDWMEGNNAATSLHYWDLRRAEALQNRILPWTPALTFATPGDLSLGAYSVQWGEYLRIGRRIELNGAVTVTPTFTTAAGALRITGIPFAAANISGNVWLGGNLEFQNVTKANYTQFSPQIGASSIFIHFGASGSGQALDVITAANITSGASTLLRFKISYRY